MRKVSRAGMVVANPPQSEQSRRYRLGYNIAEKFLKKFRTLNVMAGFFYMRHRVRSGLRRGIYATQSKHAVVQSYFDQHNRSAIVDVTLDTEFVAVFLIFSA